LHNKELQNAFPSSSVRIIKEGRDGRDLWHEYGISKCIHFDWNVCKQQSIDLRSVLKWVLGVFCYSNGSCSPYRAFASSSVP
jgi:hypothetical protein